MPRSRPTDRDAGPADAKTVTTPVDEISAHRGGSDHVTTTGSLKYAVVERERRYLVATMPAGVTDTRTIVDHYIDGTRLRLREVEESDGTLTRKLNHKVRLGDGPAEIACTSIYLDEEEWALLSTLPARTLRKTRHLVETEACPVAVDELEDGTLLAEIDDGDQPPTRVPGWLDVVRDVSTDEAWTGGELARRRADDRRDAITVDR